MDYTTQQQQPIVPGPRPKNWLVESILCTILCCQPFGIAGIVFASQVNSKYDTGDYEGSLRASKEAGKWTKVSFFVGIGWWVLCILWFAFWGGLGMWNARNSY